MTLTLIKIAIFFRGVLTKIQEGEREREVGSGKERARESCKGEWVTIEWALFFFLT